MSYDSARANPQLFSSKALSHWSDPEHPLILLGFYQPLPFLTPSTHSAWCSLASAQNELHHGFSQKKFCLGLRGFVLGVLWSHLAVEPTLWTLPFPSLESEWTLAWSQYDGPSRQLTPLERSVARRRGLLSCCGAHPWIAAGLCLVVLADSRLASIALLYAFLGHCLFSLWGHL